MAIQRSNQLTAKHPGYVFEHRFLNSSTRCTSEIALEMGVSSDDLVDFLNGNVSVNSTFATKLADVTGMSAAFWVNLQRIYAATQQRE